MGYGAGLNRGLRGIAESPAVVLLCNPDIVLLTPDSVEEALAFMASHQDVGCLVPRLVDGSGKVMASVRPFYSVKSLLASRMPWLHGSMEPSIAGANNQAGRDDSPVDVDWGCGAAMFYRMGSLSDARIFDERYFLYMEDVDFCTRLWQQGRRVVLFPGVVFRHDGQRMSSRSWLYFLRHCISIAKYVVKFRGLPKR